MTPDKPKRGRPPMPGGRGDADKVAISIRLTKAEAAQIDVEREGMTRSAFVRAVLNAYAKGSR